MMTQASATHLLCALMTKNNKWSNGNKWAAHIKAPIGNALAIEHKYKDSLTIKARNGLKRKKWQNPKVHKKKKIQPKATPKSISLSKAFLFLT